VKEKSEAKIEYEIRRQERLQQKETLSKNDRRGDASKRIVLYVVLFIILALIFLGIKSLIKNSTPQGEDFSKDMQDAGREHIEVGDVVLEETYSSNPPSSGPHYPNTANTGFYTEPVEDQYLIHNLEHGDIWIAYSPNISENAKKILKSFAGTYVVVAPRPDNPSDVSLVAWNRLDNFDEESLTEQRVKDFILRHDNKGPEKVRGGGGF